MILNSAEAPIQYLLSMINNARCFECNRSRRLEVLSYQVRGQILNLNVTEKCPTHCTHYRTVSQMQTKGSRIEAIQKGNPYHHGFQKYRNSSVYLVDITPFHTKKYARMNYYTVMSEDYNLAHTEIKIRITSQWMEFPLTGLQKNFHPRSLKMSRI